MQVAKTSSQFYRIYSLKTQSIGQHNTLVRHLDPFYLLQGEANSNRLHGIQQNPEFLVDVDFE